MDVIIDAVIEAIQLLFAGDPSILRVIGLTIQVSGSALVLASVFGIPVGVLMGLESFPGKRLLRVLITTGMGLPPVFVGLLVYLALSRTGPLGDLGWLFTPRAMILAQTILAFPLAAGLTMAAVQDVPTAFVQQIRAIGATPFQERWTILTEARRGVYAAVLAAFGRIIAEVGAVFLVGGNIAGETRVLTTSILLETRQGNFPLALALGMILLGLALIGNAVFLRLEGRVVN